MNLSARKGNGDDDHDYLVCWRFRRPTLHSDSEGTWGSGGSLTVMDSSVNFSECLSENCCERFDSRVGVSSSVLLEFLPIGGENLLVVSSLFLREYDKSFQNG